MSESTLPLIGHLMELRNRLLRCVMAVFVVFLSLVYFAPDIYHLLASPLLAVVPAGSSMIAIDVASPFLAPIKLTLVLSIFVAMPFILGQVWGFIAPGLYQHERRLLIPLLVGSGLLFYAGVIFAYTVIFPIAFSFFASIGPQGIPLSPDINSYLDFVLTIFFAFGLAFEIPIATVLLCWSGATTPAQLRSKRAYVVVGAFVVGMLLTPPDVISQTLLALPMLLLFEVGLFMARFYTPSRSKNAEAES